jgi:hypothetical protein
MCLKVLSSATKEEGEDDREPACIKDGDGMLRVKKS